MNICIFCGNVGKDPTLHKAGDGQVARFSIAIKQKANEPPLWLECEAWDGERYQLASLIVQHVRKGAKVTISGELREDRWEDKEGVKRRSMKVRVQNAQW